MKKIITLVFYLW